MQHLIGWAAALVSLAVAQSSISSRFADVILEHVTPGKAYNLRTMRDMPYRVMNRSADPVELVLEVEIPQSGQLKPGYQSIADPSWIRLVPDRLSLGPGEEAAADVILQVPDGTEHVGRHFQAHILCRTADPKPGQSTGLVFGLALSSRLRFSIGSAGPEEVRRMQKEGLYQMLNFTLEPQSANVPGFLDPGSGVDLTQDKGVGLSLINRSPQKLRFRLRSVRPPSEMGPAAGYERTPDPAWLKVRPEILTVPGASIKNVRLRVEIPNQPELRGKRYMFVIQAGLQDREIPVEVYTRVYVNVRP